MNDYSFCGFGVKGYRSFSGHEPSLVGLFGKTHIVTGRNNSGKSSLVDFAQTFLPALKSAHGGNVDLKKAYQALDRPISLDNSADAREPEVLLSFSLNAVLKAYSIRKTDKEKIKAILRSIGYLNDDNQRCWFSFRLKPNSQMGGSSYSMVPIFSVNNLDIYQGIEDLTKSITGSCLVAVPDANRANLERILSSITPYSSIPDVLKIQAIRDVFSDSSYREGDPVTSGRGLPNALNALRNPSRERYADSNKRYKAFLSLVRDVLDDSEADVLVPSDCSEINVATGGTPYLPLEKLGTGIKELIMLAAIVACNENKLICIEEPEIHLHASLQERLIRYLEHNGSNRFILTTHSPTIINSKAGSVTQVVKEGGVSFTKDVSETLDTKRLLQDLGIKPSDIMQANYVIWVEGPSDRVYVKHWISCVNPELIEGIHFSIMHYGGKLLSGIEASSKIISTSLSNVFAINSNFCILMDSDRTRPREKINATKLRIRSECDEADAFSWVTEGRTIENYVPGDTLRQALNNLYGDKTYDHPLDNQYICPLGFKFEGLSYGPNKIDVAHEVCKIGYELTGDLLRNARKLSAAIAKANGITSL